jgi:hypothetical protein
MHRTRTGFASASPLRGPSLSRSVRLYREPAESNMTTQQKLAKIGAVAAVSGPVAVLVTTLLHPMSADPNDPTTAFVEYAADSLWVASHLGQFIGFSTVAVALIGLAAATEHGRPSAWARIGVIGTTASVAMAGALQAVDGVALRAMVRRWVDASGEARQRAFEGALAIRQVEIGFASVLGVLFGLTVVVFGISMISGRRFPSWLGGLGLLAGISTSAGGVAAAYTGFSPLQMMISMVGSAMVALWIIVTGVFLWRVAPRLSENEGAV